MLNRKLAGKTVITTKRDPAMNSKRMNFEDLRVGDRWTSPSRIITSDDVSEFAHLTGDYNPLHMDEQFARKTPFRQPIAHGLLGLSFVAGLGSESPLVDTVAFLGVNNWKFCKPVYFGDTVHVMTEVVQMDQQGRKRGRVIWKRELINQRGEVVQCGLFETLVATRKPEHLRLVIETVAS
ncbi:MAG: MaoC/PaaZ C-terminal domain-containing protein [Pirellulaceae bacterium]|nr:MaoC family dehydratase N-terminal domain-containing protein [Planctomycetales bacterium]